MRLTKEDGRVLLGAIRAELESQHWRQMKRGEYRPLLPRDVEQAIRDEDILRAKALREVRGKIRRQMSFIRRNGNQER